MARAARCGRRAAGGPQIVVDVPLLRLFRLSIFASISVSARHALEAPGPPTNGVRSPAGRQKKEQGEWRNILAEFDRLLLQRVRRRSRAYAAERRDGDARACLAETKQPISHRMALTQSS